MIKVLLILVYLAFDYGSLLERVGSLGMSPGLVMFLGLYGFIALLLFLTAFIRTTWLRIALGVLFASASIFQQGFEWVTLAPFTYESFINMLHSSGQLGEALQQHGPTLMRAFALGLLLFAGIVLPVGESRVPQRVALLAPFVSVAVLAGLLYLRGGEGSRALPAAVPPLSFAVLMVAEDIATPDGPRQAVQLPLGEPIAPEDVVLLVDESIAGNYLDINNANGVRSGLKDVPSTVSRINFGYAASIHDCSANSNVVLRFGGTRDNYQLALAHYAPIWSYAKKAGLRTVYIDGQSSGGRLQNMMTKAERALIDEFVQPDVPVLDKDMAIADILARHINNGQREFIYVNKIGAHFPVQDKFPDRLMKYAPVLPRGSHDGITWSSDRTGFNGSPAEWVRYRNSYRNTLLWNVGTFFDRFLSVADLSRATVIYTSDHGQDLHERGNPGNNTHCGGYRASQEVGLVPLVVLEGKDNRSLDWQRHLATTRNGMSHFRIFPTLLTLMGYDRAAIRETYGPALDEPDPDDFSYNVLFNTRLGRKPEWQKIELDKIVDPPASDYSMRPVSSR